MADSYDVVKSRILSLPQVETKESGSLSFGGKVYPIYSVVTKPVGTGKRHNVLLTGGVHGDEPAGVHAILEFLQKQARSYAERFKFFTFPCVNPAGFQQGQANNPGGQNINRSFEKGSTVPEALVVMKQLEAWGENFAFTIDMHEIPPDWEGEGQKKENNPRAAYLYETNLVKKDRIGSTLMRKLPKDIEVCDWPKIYGDIAVGGLITYPEGNRNPFYAAGTSLDSWVQGRYSSHTFTSETPVGWPLAKRIRTHLSWLTSALDEYAKLH